MSRTLKLVFSKEEGIKKSWKYCSRDYCTHCGHHHCCDPIGVKGLKSLKKGKGRAKDREFILNSDDDDDDG